MKTVKFGGSSLACAGNILRAKSIIEADPSRTFIVVSAPGKCADFPRKVTDLLIDAHAQLCFVGNCDSCDTVFRRFEKISADLNVGIAPELERVREEIYINKCDYDFIVSRGEYLMAVLFAKLLGFKFLDAAHYIVIKKSGHVEMTQTMANFRRLVPGKYVMGGFYGTSAQYDRKSRGAKKSGGCVKTFPRGGSDFSGAIAAVCLGAEMYENFTDTYGVQSANPILVENTRTVAEIDFATLHKLSKGGASVIYPNCLPLLARAGMPLRVDNTYDPGRKFTQVTAGKPSGPFFSITYETKQNINKDTVEILCVLNKIELPLECLRGILKDIEVYLVGWGAKEIRLLTTAGNLARVVGALHEWLRVHSKVRQSF